MKKLILLIFFVLLFITAPDKVIAKDPECWTTHMVKQMSDCSKAFLECNLPCSRIGDSSTRIACLGSCSQASNLCRDKASADYRACVRAGNQIQQEVKELKSTEPQTDQKKSNQQTSSDPQDNQQNQAQQSPQPAQSTDMQKNQSRGWIPLFATGWIEYFQNLWKIVNFKFTGNPFVQFVNEVGGIDHTLCDPATCDISLENLKRQTGLSEEEIINNPPSNRERETNPYKIDRQNGEVYIGDYDKGKGFILKTGKDGVIFSTFLGLEDDIGGVEVLPNTEINLPPQPFQEWKEIEWKDKVELESGEAEFFIIGSAEKPTIRPTFIVATPNTEVKVSGTHFWVSYDKDKNFSTVGVYEGKVEVKTKDGKKTTVSPEGDKPGVVLVSSKFSPLKLGIVSLVLATIIGGGTFLLKRKFAKGISKKKK